MKKLFTGLIFTGMTLALGFAFPSYAKALDVTVTPTGEAAQTISSVEDGKNYYLGTDGIACNEGCTIGFGTLTSTISGSSNYVEIGNSAYLDEDVVTVNNPTTTTPTIALTSDFKEYGKLVVKLNAMTINLYASSFAGFNVSTPDIYSAYNTLLTNANNSLMFNAEKNTREINVNYMVNKINLTIPKQGTTKLGTSAITSETDSDLKLEAVTGQTYDYSIDLEGKIREPKNTAELKMTVGENTVEGKLVVNKVAIEPTETNGVVTVKYSAMTNARPTGTETSSSLLETYCAVTTGTTCTAKSFDPYVVVLYYAGDVVKGVKQFKLSEGTKTGDITKPTTAYSYSGIKVLDPDNNVGYDDIDSLGMFISNGQISATEDLKPLKYGVDGGFVYELEGSEE